MAKCRECKNRYSASFWDINRICPSCKEKELPFKALLSETTPWLFLTPTLISINLLVFTWMVLSGVSFSKPEAKDLVIWGGNLGVFTADQPWRLLTCCFVHIGVFHLLLNMWCLWALGKLAERMFGNLTFLMLYLLSGIGGSIVSVWWHPGVVSVGASGAVFGVAGGLIAFLYLGDLQVPSVIIKRNLTNVFCFVAYSIANGFSEAGIDNAAHLGGLLIGLVFGALLHRPLPRPDSYSRLRRFTILSGLSLLLILAAQLARTSIADNPLTKLANAGKLLQSGQIEKAVWEYTKVIELDPKLAAAYSARGSAYLSRGQYDQAISDFDQAININPNLPDAYVNRGSAYDSKGQYDQAISDCSRAIQIAPKHYVAYCIRGTIYFNKGDFDQAVSDFCKAIEFNSKYAYAYSNRGLAYGRKGKLEQGISDFSKAIELDPKLSHAYTNRAIVYFIMGSYDNAWADIRMAQTLNHQIPPEFLKALREASGRDR